MFLSMGGVACFAPPFHVEDVPMSISRTKGLSTKLTDEEYTELEGAAGEQTLSVWAREVLLKAARRQAAESIVVAEVLALRTILLNLQYAQSVGNELTADRMQQLIDRADQDRFRRAAERLAEAAANGVR